MPIERITIQYLLFGALVANALAFAVLLANWKWQLETHNRDRRHPVFWPTGLGLFAAGSVIAACAWVLRWHQVGHVPMQNMFEVFLTMGVPVFPLSMFCWHFLRAGSRTFDALLAVGQLLSWMTSLRHQPSTVPPPHEDGGLGPHLNLEAATYRLVVLGFPLLTLGLILGSIWGKIAWGDYWNWDPKELWSLASWLILLAYLHVRVILRNRVAWVNSLLVILGFLAIIVTLLWVNLAQRFKGMHSYAS